MNKISKKKSLRINIIPLIDIIFLMLVFFMLATNFTKNNEVSFTVNNQKQIFDQIENLSLSELLKINISDDKKTNQIENLVKNYENQLGNISQKFENKIDKIFFSDIPKISNLTSSVTILFILYLLIKYSKLLI